MIWNLETIKHEIVAFAEHTKKTLGEEIDWVVEELVNCPVEISKRMTRTKGMFEFEYVRKGSEVVAIRPKKIKIAQYLLDNYHNVDIIETIRHECVHLIVDVYKRDNMGHNKTFKQFCQMLGVSDETYFTASPKTNVVEITKTMENRYVGKCQGCGHEYYRKQLRKSTLENWIKYCYCHKCQGKLHITDTRDKVVYMQDSKGEILMVSLEKAKTKPTEKPKKKPKPRQRTKSQLINALYKMKAYSTICCDGGFNQSFDSIWWDVLIAHDNGGWGEFTQGQMNTLYRWLNEGQKYCEDSEHKRIVVGMRYV